MISRTWSPNHTTETHARTLHDETFALTPLSESSYRHGYSDPERLSQFSDYYHFLVERGFEPDSENKGAPVFSRHMEADV